MDRYHEVDKQATKEIKESLKQDGIESYPVECRRCKGSGFDSYSEMASIHEPCPDCNGNGGYELEV